MLLSRYSPIELALAENTLFALPPINRIVPTPKTKMTASITAYSAISWLFWRPELAKKISHVCPSHESFKFYNSMCLSAHVRKTCDSASGRRKFPFAHSGV